MNNMENVGAILRVIYKSSDGLKYYRERIIGVVFFLLGKSSKRIFVFGDSHSLVFKNRRGVLCRHLGPLTLHRFGRDGEAARLIENAFSWPRRMSWLPFPRPAFGSTVLVSFGEIDVRVHVKRVSEKNGCSPSVVLEQLADNALLSLQQLRCTTESRIVFLGSPPPRRNSYDERFPTSGDFEERVKWTRELKRLIASKISSHGMQNVYFIDVADRFQGDDGELLDQFSDGTVHYRRGIGSIILNEIINL